jgi:large subunit ribosomal protein L30
MPASKGARKGGGRAAARRPPSRPAAKKAAPRARAAARARESVAAERPENQERPLSGGTIRIEQYRSGIGCISRQKRILRALGLRHPRQVVARPDNPAVRGMVLAIPHLVRIVGGA